MTSQNTSPGFANAISGTRFSFGMLAVASICSMLTVNLSISISTLFDLRMEADMNCGPFSHMNSRRILTVAVRWIARTWGVASALLLLAFAFGGREHLRFTMGEVMAFLLFPVGVIIGFVIAWWRELTGGLVTVGCFFLFYLLLLTWSGRWPGIYFILFAAPGFLHIASFILGLRLVTRFAKASSLQRDKSSSNA